jgi:hypothetical protein
VLAAHHLQKLGAHLVAALTRLHANNIARRSNLEVDSIWEKRAGKSEDR